MSRKMLALALAAQLAVAATTQAGEKTGLKKGTPDLKSAAALGFAPGGILLVGDPTGAAVFAIATGDEKGDAEKVTLNVEGINEKAAAALGAEPQNILINDLAVNPESGVAYLSVSRGRGPDATPVILRIDAAGKLGELSLEGVMFAKASLPNPPAPGGTGRDNLRSQAITDLAYVDGRVIVAGLSNEEFASNLRSIPFPFEEAGEGTSVEIYHGAHGAFETRSPVRTFAIYNIGDQPHVLAAYTCTPLVKFPLADLQPGTKVRGTTVAELGNRNRPLDMVVYQQDGKDFLLLANNSRGVMKISTENLDTAESITEPVRGGGKAGQPYETIAELKGIVELDRLNEGHIVVIAQTEGGRQDLKTIPLP
jgi:hypothetical protein